VIAVLSAIALQALLALLTTSMKLHAGTDDTDIYFRYARRARESAIPYRDYRVEYPPIAMPLFLLPSYVSSGLVSFRLAFAVEMLIFNAGTVWLIASWTEQNHGPVHVRSRLAWYTVFFLLLSRLVVSRFDSAPTFLAFAGSAWWFGGRGVLGGLALSIGAFMKVYPAVVVPLGAAWERTQSGGARQRGAMSFALSSLIGVLAWLALGGAHGVLASLDYQLGRGFEYGSVYSSIQMLGAKLAGARIDIVRDRAAWSSITPWSATLARAVFPLQTAAILMVWGAFLRRGMREGLRYSGAAVLALVVTGKVFSPQYLIWLMPFVAVLDAPIARRGCWIFAAGCAITLLAPALTAYFPRTSLWVILAYNLKNALFLWLFWVLTFGPSADRSAKQVEDGFATLDDRDGAPLVIVQPQI
jgi:hypothetical protein